MSQEKVDHYKEKKKTRRKDVKKEKIIRRLEITFAVAIFAVLVGWFGVAVYKNAVANQTVNAKTYSIDVTDLDGYTSTLTTETAE